mgnify:CR=1 FL=1
MLFYDFEVYKYWWCVVIAEVETEKWHVIDTKEELESFYNDHIHDIWVGYNSRGYDQYILKGILLGYDPKKINDYIIVQGEPGWKFCNDFKKMPLVNYDAIVKRAGNFMGLKELEYHMGDSIVECNIPFDLDRPLTNAEITEVVAYCKNDVEALMKTFLLERKKFDAHMGLVKMYNLPINFIDTTDAKLTSKVLKAERVHGRTDEFDIILPDTLQLNKYQYIADWYLNDNNHNYESTLSTMVYGLKHDYAWGGFHAAEPNVIVEGFIVDSDIASLYPSLMIEYGLLSRNIPLEYQGLYEEIKNNRIKLKKEKNPLQEALKLILNTTYGILKDVNNDMYDPNSSNLVCIFGQLLMTDLIEKLEEYFGSRLKLIQSNTDGIFIKLESEALFDEYKEVCQKWSERTGLVVEHEQYVKMVQKDVNDYIAIREDGSTHRKGAYVKQLSENDYELAILNKALVDYFVNGIAIEDTINQCDDLKEFQMCAKKSANYDYLMHGDKKLQHKYYRVYASKDRQDKGLFKVGKRGTKEKVAKTPTHCFIHNESVNGVKCPDKLDKTYYIEMAYERLKQFVGYDVRQMRLF